MVETEIDVRKDQKWFSYLIDKKGFLPSEAVRKIEHDKARNIEAPKTSFFDVDLNLREDWWFWGSLGIIAGGIIYIYAHPRK